MAVVLTTLTLVFLNDRTVGRFEGAVLLAIIVATFWHRVSASRRDRPSADAAPTPVDPLLPQLAWLVFGVALVWAVIYDTFYAMVDREDDKKLGVKSTAILFGEVDLFVIAGLQILMLTALAFIGDMAELGPWYFGSVGIAAILMGYHQWLARDRKPAGCFEAFLHNHYIGMIVFIGIVLHYTFDGAAAAPL